MSGALWHPFPDMGAIGATDLIVERGEGAWVWDEQGRRYLDATAALWYSNLGHSRSEITEAVERQMRRLDAYSIFGDCSNRPAIELAERLAAIASVYGSKVFLGSGGGDMIDTAAKLARNSFGEPEEIAKAAAFLASDAAHLYANITRKLPFRIPHSGAGRLTWQRRAC